MVNTHLQMLWLGLFFFQGARLNKLYESWEENTDIGFVVMKVKVLFLEAWVFFFFFAWVLLVLKVVVLVFCFEVFALIIVVMKT